MVTTTFPGGYGMPACNVIRSRITISAVQHTSNIVRGHVRYIRPRVDKRLDRDFINFDTGRTIK